MSFSHFLRIEYDSREGSNHYVVHTQDPTFSLELAPDREAPNKIGQGVIKRVCLPNSWAGDYGRYAGLINSAQEFFRRSFDEPTPKAGAHRLLR